RVTVDLSCPVRPGDGVVFEGDRLANAEQGGRVYQVFTHGRQVSEAHAGQIADLAFDRRSVDLQKLATGLQVWKTDDPQLNRRLRESWAGADPRRRVALQLRVKAHVGSVLEIEGKADNGAVCNVVSDQKLEVAKRHPADESLLSTQLGRLGGTVYRLTHLVADFCGAPMIPHSVLGQLRRQMVEQLAASVPVPKRAISNDSVLAQLRSRMPPTEFSRQDPSLTVLCRNLDQLKATGNIGAQTIITDFADIREYREAVRWGNETGVEVAVATPRIQKPGEVGIFRAIARLQPSAVLVRNLSGIRFFRDAGIKSIGDFSLNVTNELTAEFLMGLGLRSVAASYDMNRDQLLNLAHVIPAQWLDVVIHQHMPMFHMEHCVFCAVLSPGTNKSNCGRPCDHHQVELRDRAGIEHPLTADVGCRNTLFNAIPQSGAELVPELLNCGIRSFRVELLRESPEELRRIVELYRQLIDGHISGTSVWKSLNAMNRVGITRGTLEHFTTL
ncbi:MAG: DUF3656 domain-containing protein, partial [Planctomycetaceae bacterium]|nr:DUF3656 domain-containing protein [Planctomycetaceae bacterium]